MKPWRRKRTQRSRQNHYYDVDVWSQYGKKIADLIPEGMIVYGELIGFTPEGASLQKGYTYHLNRGECELFVYRVAHINRQGHLSDLSWDGVKEFCQARGLKWTPELFRWQNYHLEDLEDWLDVRFTDIESEYLNEKPLPLSDPKTVDEGICIRQEGLVPLILKAKSPKFLEHETKLLDEGDIDLESVA